MLYGGLGQLSDGGLLGSTLSDPPLALHAQTIHRNGPCRS